MKLKKSFSDSILKVTVGLFTLLTMHSVSATVINFNATNLGVPGGAVYDSVTLTLDNISVVVDAFSIDNDGNGNISALTPLSGGNGVYVSSSSSGNLGVVSSSSDGTNLDGASPGSGALDVDEGLRLTFSQVVRLDYVNFDSWGLSDDFNLTVDGVSTLVDFHAGDSSPFATGVPGEPDEFTFAGINGTEFLFWADSNSDGFRLDRLEVPAPAGLWLFAMGVGLLLTGSRKRPIR